MDFENRFTFKAMPQLRNDIPVQVAIERLQAYENTRLSPVEVFDIMRQFAELKEEHTALKKQAVTARVIIENYRKRHAETPYSAHEMCKNRNDRESKTLESSWLMGRFMQKR